MRILSIVELLGAGGAEGVLVDLVRGLPEHEHVVWHFNGVNGVPPYRPHVRRLRDAGALVADHDWRDLADPARRAAALNGFVPDIVIAHWWGGDPWLRWIRDPATRPRPQFVCVAHDSRYQLESGFDRYVLVAEFQRSQTRRLRGADVRVIPNGTELARFEGRTRASRSDPAQPLVIGSLAGLRPNKTGSDWARTVCAWDLPGSRFLVAGDGPLRSELESDVAASGRSRDFDFMGHVPHRSVPRFLRSLDVLFNLTAPDVRECSPRAVIEALAAGVPVVGLADGGMTELIEHEVNGLLARDADDMGRQLKRLAEDRSLVRRLAAGATESRASLDHRRQIEAYRQLLAGLATQVNLVGAA